MAFDDKFWDWNTRPNMKEGMPQTFYYTSSTDTIADISGTGYFNKIIEFKNISAFPANVADLIDATALKDSTAKAPKNRILLEITGIDYATGVVTVTPFDKTA